MQLAQTTLYYRPMQAPPSSALEAAKRQEQETIDCTKVTNLLRSKNQISSCCMFFAKGRGLIMKHFALIALAAAPLCFLNAPAVYTQPFPMIDQLAQRVVQKYQGSSCQQLAEKEASRGHKRERWSSGLSGCCAPTNRCEWNSSIGWQPQLPISSLNAV